MNTIKEFLSAIRMRMNYVSDEFIKSGKAIDFRLGEYVNDADLTVGHYSEVLNGADGEERLWDIEDNCPTVYYDKCLENGTVSHAFCVGVYSDGKRMMYLLYDMNLSDFVVALPYDIVEGREYVIGSVEEFMREHSGDKGGEDVEQ